MLSRNATKFFLNFSGYHKNMPACKSVETLAYDDEMPQTCGYGMGGFGNFVLWFVIIFVIIWFIMWLTKPAAVQTRNPDGSLTGNIDAGKVLVASLVIALIIIVLVWLFRSLCKF